MDLFTARLAGSPASASSSEPVSALTTPQERSPLVTACRAIEPHSRASSSSLDTGHVAAPAVPTDAITQFSQQLVSNRSADRWLEEQTATAAAKGELKATLARLHRSYAAAWRRCRPVRCSLHISNTRQRITLLACLRLPPSLLKAAEPLPVLPGLQDRCADSSPHLAVHNSSSSSSNNL